MSDLYWVVGEWKGRVQGGMMFESWEIAEDGSMEGNACTIARGDTIFSESMQIIDKDGDIFYMVKLADVKKTVAFKLVEISSKGCVFENPDHDFPNRIVYANTVGDMLLARIEGVRNQQPDTARFFMHRQHTFKIQ
ncbi:MAG: hypothetical protein JKY52_12110 [Flavobacteriales bacterium]|nr:hypothetical protein [Flavobacteriales bacterium]